jgi:hypothetical protein
MDIGYGEVICFYPASEFDQLLVYHLEEHLCLAVILKCSIPSVPKTFSLYRISSMCSVAGLLKTKCQTPTFYANGIEFHACHVCPPQCVFSHLCLDLLCLFLPNDLSFASTIG